MKRILILLLGIILALGFTGCDPSSYTAKSSTNIPTGSSHIAEAAKMTEASPQTEASAPAEIEDKAGNDMIKIKITAGESTFTAALLNNETSLGLIDYFPMTIQMTELNGQEKFYNLPATLTSSISERPPTIQSGDIMCWSGNCLVLFYTTYSNSYGGYVPLGKVDDPSGLANALGSGDIEVTWALADE